MKVTIAYIDGEEKEAALIQRFAKRLLDDVEVVTSKRRDGMCDGCLRRVMEVAVPCEEGGHEG